MHYIYLPKWDRLSCGLIFIAKTWGGNGFWFRFFGRKTMRRKKAAWFCAAPGATVTLRRWTMCEGDCNRTIRHFAVVLSILKPTTWRSEAAHYQSASERRRRCRAPSLRRGDSTFLTSGVNWSLGIKKKQTRTPCALWCDSSPLPILARLLQ